MIRRRRRSDFLHDHDDPLAQLAAEIVTRALDRRFQPMVLTAAIVGLIAALCVSLPITLLENAGTDRAALARARHSCRLVTHIAKVLGSGDPHDPKIRQGGFISSDAELRKVEAQRATRIRGHGPLASLLADPNTLMLERQNSVTEAVTLGYWTHELIPALLDAAHADCAV